jgi:hypothetical protein
VAKTIGEQRMTIGTRRTGEKGFTYLLLVRLSLELNDGPWSRLGVDLAWRTGDTIHAWARCSQYLSRACRGRLHADTHSEVRASWGSAAHGAVVRHVAGRRAASRASG